MQRHELRGQPQLLLVETLPEGELPPRPRQAVCDLDATPAQARVGARLGERQTTLFRFGDWAYALNNREPGSAANVLSRGLLGNVGGELVAISPLYKQRIHLHGDWSCDGSEQVVRV